MRGLSRKLYLDLSVPTEEDQRSDQQREHGDEIADGVERERADRVGADVLRDEGGAPDERG